MVALQISRKRESLHVLERDRPQNYKTVWNFATFARLPFG